jgi:Sensors of blue-light using FAD
MLVRLLYASRAEASMNDAGLHAILKQSHAHNPEAGITGVLCACMNARIFIQVLEGGRSQVSGLYHRIAQDPRHTDVELLCYEDIAERRFASWSMGQVNMNRLNPALLLRYSETAKLDPYAVPGQATMALFNELVATASVVGQG